MSAIQGARLRCRKARGVRWAGRCRIGRRVHVVALTFRTAPEDHPVADACPTFGCDKAPRVSIVVWSAGLSRGVCFGWLRVESLSDIRVHPDTARAIVLRRRRIALLAHVRLVRPQKEAGGPQAAAPPLLTAPLK